MTDLKKGLDKSKIFMVFPKIWSVYPTEKVFIKGDEVGRECVDMVVKEENTEVLTVENI